MKFGTPVGYSHKMTLNTLYGWGTYIFYGSPSREAFVDDEGAYLPEYRGRTMCPGASPECFKHCLIHSGQMIMPHAKQARVRKTRLLIDDPEEAGRLLRWDIDAHLRWCKKHGMLPSFRFNGTTDFAWEEFVLPETGETPHRYLERVEPGAMVNEYTKRYGVMRRYLDGEFPSNLYMTFSLHELNGLQARSILKLGGNVAIVFRSKKHELPTAWEGRPVLDGDVDDLRWMDQDRARKQGIDAEGGMWIGLSAKGRLARTISAFAVDSSSAPSSTYISLPMAA